MVPVVAWKNHHVAAEQVGELMMLYSTDPALARTTFGTSGSDLMVRERDIKSSQVKSSFGRYVVKW